MISIKWKLGTYSIKISFRHNSLLKPRILSVLSADAQFIIKTMIEWKQHYFDASQYIWNSRLYNFFPLKVDYDLENCTSWVHIEKVLKFIQSYLDYMDSINQEAIQDAKKSCTSKQSRLITGLHTTEYSYWKERKCKIPSQL